MSPTQSSSLTDTAKAGAGHTFPRQIFPPEHVPSKHGPVSLAATLVPGVCYLAVFLIMQLWYPLTRKEVEKNTAAAIIVTVHLSMYQKRVYPEPAGRAMPNITAAYSMASLVCGALNKTQPR